MRTAEELREEAMQLIERAETNIPAPAVSLLLQGAAAKAALATAITTRLDGEEP